MTRTLSITALSVAFTLASTASRPGAAAPSAARSIADTAYATEPSIRLTLPWVASQLVPSPELALRPREVHFGVRWQITPLLYSFGINRKLSPWRWFIAEPLTRHAGSIELFGSPEYIVTAASFEDNWLLRGGLRAYFPLVQGGDYLSCSIGGSAVYDRGRAAASYEAGIYTLFGGLGVQVTYTPTPIVRSTTLTLSLRYF